MQRRLTSLDRLIATVDTALREVSSGTGSLSGERPSPATDHSEADLTDAERQHAGGLMRINHTGEVCAQALTVWPLVSVRSQLIVMSFRLMAERGRPRFQVPVLQ